MKGCSKEGSEQIAEQAKDGTDTSECPKKQAQTNEFMNFSGRSVRFVEPVCPGCYLASLSFIVTSAGKY